LEEKGAMITCECGEQFDDHDEAIEHVREKHTDECDNRLQEYVEDSVRDDYEDLMTEDEET
jgi:hypothetical protein